MPHINIALHDGTDIDFGISIAIDCYRCFSELMIDERNLACIGGITHDALV